jgi:transglutaminase-like putative cysteine protease
VPILRISHRTDYHFQIPVTLNPHRLMLRPREGLDVCLAAYELDIAPAAEVIWAEDIFGNAVATATFSRPAASLAIQATSDVEITSAAWPVFPIAASAISYPFAYSDEERIDLGALATLHDQDSQGPLKRWTEGFVARPRTDTLSLLKDLNEGVRRLLRYESREDEGTQSAARSLERGAGSCRDFAVLFAEAARALGLGARITSGYLYDPDQARVGSAGSGSTHAWVEIYIPGAGWLTFDPTNGRVGSFNLIPVAVARSIQHVVPVTGSFAGGSEANLGMTVEVNVALRPAS